MNRFFYAKMAAVNLRKNFHVCFPYILSCVYTIAMFYMMFFLTVNEGVESTTLSLTLGLGTVLVAIFSVLFLFYTYSFLIKRRKKEFGVFNILGLSKADIAKVILMETVYIALASLVLGIGAGILFSRLMHLLFLNLLNFDIKFGFEIPVPALVNTVILFSVIFVLILLNTLRQIYKTQPAELLRDSSAGEREPKTRWITAFLAVLLLGTGYYLAVSPTEPMIIIIQFFIAVILVTVGTHCLFAAGSIAILKTLRKNTGYYYQTKHFISISGLIYRMKQNAAGLANICILSTMVLVMISSTATLFFGLEDALKTRYPKDISMGYAYGDGENEKAVDGIIAQTLGEYNLLPLEQEEYSYLLIPAKQSAYDFSFEEDWNFNDENSVRFCFMTQEDFKLIKEIPVQLKENEISIYSEMETFERESIELKGRSFSIVESGGSITGIRFGTAMNGDMVKDYYVAVKDLAVLKELEEFFRDEESQSRIIRNKGFELNADYELNLEVYSKIDNGLHTLELDEYYAESRAAGREDFLGMYGSLFFLGLFLGSLFIMAAVLIMYYKQLSEGYDDKGRFDIMQKVGLSREEVGASVRAQVLLLFSIPVIMACVHIAFAFPAIVRMLALLNLVNIKLYVLCTLGSITVYILFYVFAYIMTARSYLKEIRK